MNMAWCGWPAGRRSGVGFNTLTEGMLPSAFATRIPKPSTLNPLTSLLTGLLGNHGNRLIGNRVHITVIGECAYGSFLILVSVYMGCPVGGTRNVNPASYGF